MTATTTLARNGTTLSHDYQIDGWMGFVNGGSYTDAEEAVIVPALMDAQEAEFDGLLPANCYWFPRVSEIQGPITASLEGLDLEELMEAAALAVSERYQEIESAALATLTK